MRWLRRFRPEQVDESESLQAIESAKRARAGAESFRNEAEQLAASLRVIREDNHFSESVRRALLGGR